MKPAVIYARYSSDSQTEQSIEGQLRVCKEYAEKNGYEIVAEYIDRAMTGTNDNRPAFQRMLKDSFNKKWQYVLVYKFDRFSRDKYQSTLHKHTLKQNGVKVVSAMENIPDTPEGIILESLLEGMNQYYSAELSQKVKRGLKESRIKGLFTGGPTPYGYNVKDKKISINEEQANIVREYMFNQYYSGKRIKEIVVLLAEKGIKNNYDKPWTINMVSRILRNPNYKGCVYADDTCYTNIFPAIVSKEIFDEVNTRLKVAKRTSAHFKTDVNYLLSGKLICGKCGGLMTGDSGKGKLGKIYNYYKCFTKKKNKNLCDKKSISQEYIENIVLTATKEFLNNTNLDILSICLADTYNKSIEKDKILESLNKQLQENNKKLANFVRAIENGIFNDTTNERMKELEILNKDLQQKITSREMLVIKPLDKNVIYSFLCSFKYIDLNDKLACQRLVDMFINRVVLYDDHCDIYFNTNDDKSKQLKLKEQPDLESEILFESKKNTTSVLACLKKEQSNPKGSDCSRMAEKEGFEPKIQIKK